MVLESLLNPFKLKEKPWETFAAGILYSTIALFLSYWVFKEYSSLIMVFLVTMACVPLLYFTIRHEEILGLNTKSNFRLLKEHGRVFLFLILLFLGFTVALTFWYVVLPEKMIYTVFASQSQTIVNINNQISGGVASLDIFLKILMNNVRVLIFCILFAFLYGVGAIFILSWNASVIAAAMGNFIRKNLAAYATATGLGKAAGYFHIISIGFLRYAFHGIPEILAYFVGGLAGGIISAAVIKKDLLGDKRERVIFDSSELILIAFGILLVAAVMEVYITPILF
ncbi:stage II sporulation protein M [Candidatus Woesearchaeota archaeon]|nr:stage II sporulation protein M [Candidatus Woesearchaeota archaeon]